MVDASDSPLPPHSHPEDAQQRFACGPYGRVRAFTRVFFIASRAKKEDSRVRNVGIPQVIQLPYSSTRGKSSAKIVFELPAIHLRRLSGPSHPRAKHTKENAVKTGSQFDVVRVEKKKKPVEILIISCPAAISGTAPFLSFNSMVGAAVVASPSPFATLLRRSKFASYDPKIGQVYTTFGGDSHRGNYGIKRPLALRTREPFIAIASVDSLQQQTEWSHAEREARWIRKVAEVSGSPRVVDGSDLWKKLGPSANSQWKVDSDFAPVIPDAPALHKKALPVPRQAGIPNIDAMTPKQFQRYLEGLRALRPAFREFLEAEKANDIPEKDPRGHPARKSKVRSSNLLEQSSYPTDLHKIFLSQRAAQRINNSKSHILEQDVHPNGALAYTHLTKLEQYFWKQPLPGRVVGRQRSLVASFAGFNTRLPPNQSEGIQPIDWRSLVERGADTGKGISKFRVSLTEVSAPPQVVGYKPEGISDMDVRMHVSSHGRLDMTRANPYLPWTRECVSQVSDAPITGKKPGMTNLPPAKGKSGYILKESSKDQEARSRNLLNSLCELLDKQQTGPTRSGDGRP